MKYITILALTCMLAIPTQAQELFSVGNIKAGPGQAVSGYLEIIPMNDEGAQIPVSVVRGIQPGPALALIAGIHGYEYPGVTALSRLRQSIDPAKLSGTLILVHIANPPSFYGRTVYTSPVDGKNMNRVYPGKADGSLSERIADSITRNVIEQANYLVDLHAGDGNEALRPYVYMPVTGNAELDEKSRGLALAFGLDHIVIDTGRVMPPEASIYTDQTALSRGIPAITTETGQLGGNEEYFVDLALNGIESIMRHLGMLEGEPINNEGVVWLTDYQVIRSPQKGIFKAAVRDGYVIGKNGLLGELYNPFGERIFEFRAPYAGVVNYVVGTPPVSEGEPIGMVSHIQQD